MEKSSKSLELCDKFRKYYEDYQEKKKQVSDFSHLSPWEEDNQEYIIFREELESLRLSTSHTIYELYYESINDNFYFHDCPLSVYKFTYLERFQFFKKYNLDAEEIDFVKKELNSIILPTKYDREIFPYSYQEFMPTDFTFKVTRNKKTEFLKHKSLELGWLCVEQEDEEVRVGYDDYEMQPQLPVYRKLESGVEIETLEVETSNNKKITSNQIVLFLQEIGFFSHPKIELFPKVKQAKLISLLSGLNEKNLKTKIESLDKPSSELGDNYQKDIDFIYSLFND